MKERALNALPAVFVAGAALLLPAIAREVRLETLSSAAFASDDNAETAELSYNVYLPSGYEADGTIRYPVLYLLHGSAGDAQSWDDFWPILDDMIADGTIPPVIGIAPITGHSYWVNSTAFGAAETAVSRISSRMSMRACRRLPTETAGRWWASP
jgi:hypothetical protein